MHKAKEHMGASEFNIKWGGIAKIPDGKQET